MKLLVHACCGPCSIMPTRLLVEQGHEIAVFYANSNIAPREEYERRLAELARYAADNGFAVVEGAYDADAWEREVAPIGEAIKDFSPALGPAHVDGRADRTAGPHFAASGGTRPDEGRKTPAAAPSSVAELLDDQRRRDRCRACYRMRLEEAAAYAAGNGFDALATTLAVSPYQFTDVIREELERAAAQAGVSAHFEDYRPHYDEATRISRELGMYRQNYCGCRFSVTEAQATRAFIKRQRKAAKEARAGERALEEAQRASRAAEKRANSADRAKRRAILKHLREETRREPEDAPSSAGGHGHA